MRIGKIAAEDGMLITSQPLHRSELSTRDGKLDSQNKIHQASITTLSDKLDQNIAMLQKQFELLKSVQTCLMGYI
jgi:hypothetical protein